MIALSIGAAGVAHGVHYAVLGVGAIGMLALLGPHLLPGRPRTAYDEHDHRVLALTNQIATGSLGVATRTVGLPTAVTTKPTMARAHYLPIAIVSSAAAAGVHAALGPVHFREQLLFGLFFAGSALAQIGWSIAMVTRPSRTLLLAAVIGNSAVLLLWLVTRTVGVPGLLPTPEAIGAWDLCCGAWELAVVLTCVRLLREGSRPQALRLPPLASWTPTAQAWALGSVLLLGVLTLNGGS